MSPPVNQPSSGPSAHQGSLAQVFLSTLIGRKIARSAGTFLDKFEEKTLLKFITEGIDLIDVTPDQAKMQLKMMAMPYSKVISELDPQVCYTWLPDKHRDFFDRTPSSKEWALRQLTLIKEFLIS